MKKVKVARYPTRKKRAEVFIQTPYTQEEISLTEKDFPFEEALRSGFIRKMHGVVGGKAKEDLRAIVDGIRDLDAVWSRVWERVARVVHGQEPEARASVLEYLGLSDHSNPSSVLQVLEVTRTEKRG